MRSNTMRPSVSGTIDIETLPGEYYAFADNFYEARIMREKVPIKLASVAYKPLHLNKCTVLAYWQFKTYQEFLEAVWELCDANDYLIGHNAKKFDLKQLHSFFAAHGFKKPRCKVLDTLTAVRREFRLSSYKLKYVLVYFKLGVKIDTGGEELWFKVMDGDKTARAHFLKYNENDTRMTELLYLHLVKLGYMKGPHFRELFSAKDGCIRCGSDEVQNRGEKGYSDGLYQMVSCKNCNKSQPHYLVRKWAHRA